MTPRAAYLWYPNEATFLRFKSICVDGDTFRDFGEWRELAERQIREVEQRGVRVRKVKADAAKFSAWCRVNSHPADAESRKFFAIFEARNDAVSDN